MKWADNRERRNVMMIIEWLETGNTATSIAKKHKLSQCGFHSAVNAFFNAKMHDLYSEAYKIHKGRAITHWLTENKERVLREIRTRFLSELEERIALRIAAERKGITAAEWIEEAIKEKLAREMSR